jgi:hypothetical protein
MHVVVLRLARKQLCTIVDSEFAEGIGYEFNQLRHRASFAAFHPDGTGPL